MKKVIYITRHGETDYNLSKRVQGSGINSDLNATGKRQAQSFYQQYATIPFEIAYISQLKRTLQTVMPFVEHGLETVVVPELNEINWGELENTVYGNEADTPVNRLTQEWAAGNYGAAAPGGESLIDAADRLSRAKALMLESPYKTMLVCMHGRVMRLLLCLLTGKPLSMMDTFNHSNTALYIVEAENGRVEVIEHNSLKHLA